MASGPEIADKDSPPESPKERSVEVNEQLNQEDDIKKSLRHGEMHHSGPHTLLHVQNNVDVSMFCLPRMLAMYLGTSCLWGGLFASQLY